MDLLALARMVLDLDADAFVAAYEYHVLLDLDAIATTSQALEETYHEDLIPFRHGLLELRAEEEGQTLLLGRSVACDLVVDDVNVSSQHAELIRRPGGTWTVRDRGSTNGTTINGTTLPPNFPMPLTAGSVLGIGPSVRYTLLDPPRLHATLQPMAEDYLALMRGADLPAPVEPELGAGVVFVARCDPLPALPLPEGQPISVGRAPSNQLVLPHPNISRRHLTLTREGSEVVVRDAGSANGSYLGSQKIQREVRLKPGGAPVIVGPFEIRFAALETIDGPSVAVVDEETRRLEEIELRGSLETMPLKQLLQSVELNARTGAIRIESSEGEEGVVEFAEGRPTWAAFDELRGVDALLELVAVERGTFRFDPRGPQDLGEVPQVRDGPRIDVSFSRILMESSRRHDETRRHARWREGM